MTFELWPDSAPFAAEEQVDRPTLTPYLLVKDVTTSCVIVIPGGGYQARSAIESKPIAEWLNRIGIRAFVLNYRVAPNRHPAPLSDAQRAIRYVRYHAPEWNIDPNRIGVIGFSAGGHLASSVGTHFDEGLPGAEDLIERESSRPDAMILCYPVITFVEPSRHYGSMVNLLGDDCSEDLKELLSSEKQVSVETPSTFLWHTADDPIVPVDNSLLMASALSRHKVPYELHVYENGAHGLGLAADHPQTVVWTDECERWLRRQSFVM